MKGVLSVGVTRAVWGFSALGLFVVACGGDGGAIVPRAGSTPGASVAASAPDALPAVPADAGADVALGTPSADCAGVKAYCSAWNTRRFCTQTVSGPEWKTEACAAGCFGGACSASACTDECAIGNATVAGTCRLWDMKSGAFVDAAPPTSMHDR